MSIISDVQREVAHLDVQPRALRKFGLTVGPVFLLLAWIAWRRHWPEACLWGFSSAATALILFGTFFPPLLRPVYRLWMTLSFTLGWCMSRILLTILFFGAILPVALLGRLLGLPFARMRRPPKQASYWVDHKPRAANHHEEMF